MPEAVIVSAARSPIGRANKGSLKEFRPDDLTALIIRAALDKIPALDPNDVNDLMLGCGLPGGEAGNNMARVVTTLLGYEIPGTTLTRYCASSVQTSRMAFHAIKAGEGDVYVSAGRRDGLALPVRHLRPHPEHQEPDVRAKRRRAPRRWPRAGRTGTTRARTATCPTSTSRWARPPRTSRSCAAWTARSSTSSASAARTSPRRRSTTASGSGRSPRSPSPTAPWSTKDDGPRAGVTYEAVSQLDPVFRPDGVVTAGQLLPLNDGAAAVVIMSDTKAAELGLTPLARIVSTGVSGLSPEIMGLGPVEATKQALKHADMTIGDIDLVEINEAFAAQVVPSYQDLGIDLDRLNVNGGAIAVGHPFGMTGARLQNTMLNSLQWHDKSTGLITMCVGGGQGMAMIVERMS